MPRLAAEPPASPPAGADGSPRRRVLVLSPFPPRLDAPHGGARAIAGTIAGLARRHRVAVLYLRRAGEAPIDDWLRAECEFSEEYALGGTRRWRHRAEVARALLSGSPLWVARWRSAAFAGALRRAAQAWRPEVVQAEFHLMGQYLKALGACPTVRVLTEHEPRAAAAGGTAPPWMSRLEARTWPRYERAAMRVADAVVVLTERDARIVAPLAGSTPVAVIPLAVSVPERPLDPIGASPESLVFVGNFVHTPNVDAAVWLVREVLPLVRARCPGVTVQLVGDNAPPHVRALAGERGVSVTGLVPDVTPYYDRAAVVVAPIRLGGGMRVKVAEALALGKATVATPLALEGLGVTDRREAMIADSAHSFASTTAELLAHPEQRAALAARAHAWAREHLGVARTADAYSSLYEGLIRGGRASSPGPPIGLVGRVRQ